MQGVVHSEQEILERIIRIIRFKSKGMTITDLSRQTGIHRNSIAKYLQILLASGKVDIQLIGNAKIYTIAKRIPIASMMDCTTDSLLIINKEKKIVNVNSNFLEFFSLEKEDIFLEKYNRIRNPILDHQEINELISKGIEDGEKAAIEIILEYKGKEYDFYINIISMVLDGGEKGILLWIQDYSESMISEKAILESEQKFRNVFDYALDAIFLYEINEKRIVGDLIEVNDKALEILNYTSGEILDLPASKIIQPENWDISTQLDPDLAENYNSIFDGLFIRNGGKKIPVEISSQIFMLNDNLVVLFIIRDITKWKNTQKCLELSEERYRGILETQSESICRQYPDGTFSYVNDAFCRLCNKSREEIVGNKNILDVFPEDRKLLKDYLKKIDDNNNKIEFELRTISDSGEEIWLHWYVHALFDNNSQIFEYQSVARDITESKKAELSLLISEETARMLLDKNKSSSILFDIDGHILDYNKRFFEYFSLNKNLNDDSPIRGKNYIDILSGEEKQDIDKIFNFVKTENKQGTFKSVMGDKTFKYTYCPILAKNSDVSQIVILKNDITKEKKNEESLQNRIKVLNDLIHFLPDATFALNTENEVIAWNMAMEELTGIKKEEISRIGKNYADLFYEKNGELLIETLLNKIEEYDENQSNFNPVLKRCFCPKLNKGHGADLKCSASYLYDENNKIYGAIETITDMTRLKKTGDVLNESGMKYRSPIEEQSDMICRFSIPERRITFVNRLLCSHFGFRKTELIGEDISNIFPQSLCENIKSIQNNTPSDSIVSHYETRIVDSTKISFWQKWRIQPVFNKENELVAFNGIGKNITHKKGS